jgi:hypothetical protein
MAMVTPKQIADIIRQIADSGIGREQLQALRESGRFPALLREFMEVESESGRPELTITTYTVTVNYDMSIADMIKAGQYDWTNDDAIAEDFPVNKRESGEIELYVVHFGRYMTIKQLLAELNKRGLQLAELPELLALGAKHPELQRKYRLIAFASECRFVSGSGLSILRGDDGKRSLFFGWRDSDLKLDGDLCSFVAVRK